MRFNHGVILAALAGTLAAAGASAQPVLVMTGMNGHDLSGDGKTVAGLVYDASIETHVVYTYRVGVGATRTTARLRDGSVRCSADTIQRSAGEKSR